MKNNLTTPREYLASFIEVANHSDSWQSTCTIATGLFLCKKTLVRLCLEEVGINNLKDINYKIKVFCRRRDIFIEFLIFQSDFHRVTLTLWNNLIDSLIVFVNIQGMSIQSSRSYRIVFVCLLRPSPCNS